MSVSKELSGTIGYTFNDEALAKEAFLARGASVSRKDVDGPAEGNERLALLGDALIPVALLQEWYPRGESIRVWSSCLPFGTALTVVTEEGHDEIQKVATNKHLREVAIRNDLDQHVIRNPMVKGELPTRTLASTVEGIIGAVYVDSGQNMNVVRDVVKKML